jgi:hypothetical protein
MIETSQEPITSLKNPSEEILERAKEEPKESRQDLVNQNIILKTPQESITPLENHSEDILERAKKLII